MDLTNDKLYTTSVSKGHQGGYWALKGLVLRGDGKEGRKEVHKEAPERPMDWSWVMGRAGGESWASAGGSSDCWLGAGGDCTPGF